VNDGAAIRDPGTRIERSCNSPPSVAGPADQTIVQRCVDPARRSNDRPILPIEQSSHDSRRGARIERLSEAAQPFNRREAGPGSWTDVQIAHQQIAHQARAGRTRCSAATAHAAHP
jgi:hypothetical protein